MRKDQLLFIDLLGAMHWDKVAARALSCNPPITPVRWHLILCFCYQEKTNVQLQTQGHTFLPLGFSFLPGSDPCSLHMALEAQSFNHWISRKSPRSHFWVLGRAIILLEPYMIQRSWVSYSLCSRFQHFPGTTCPIHSAAACPCYYWYAKFCITGS